MTPTEIVLAHGPADSSRFSEYVFQFARMKETNSVLVSVRAFMQHLKHYTCRLAMEVDTKIEMPKSRRGVSHSAQRVVHYELEPGWHKSDAEICERIEIGIQECAEMWRGMLGVQAKLDDSKADYFFLNPLQSYDVGDAYLDFTITLPDGTEQIVFDELSIATDENGIDFVESEVDIVESDDQVQADDLIGALIQKYQSGGNGGGVGVDMGAAAGGTDYDQFGSILAEFNRSIQAGFKDRKLRFRETKLLKDLTAAGHTEAEWQTFSDDEDLTVNFGGHWEVGNVQGIALLAAEPTDDGKTLAVLARAQKKYVHSVPINDRRAVFLCKYYKESKRTGQELQSFQNRGCLYKLPLDSDVPYFWVSRKDVMSAVRMPRVTGAFRLRSMKPCDLTLTKDLFSNHETYG